MQRSPNTMVHRLPSQRRAGMLAARCHSLNSQRPAFTLIELAIVIGIMALLVTLLVIAIGPALASARVAAVRSTMLRIDDVIRQRVKAVNELDVSYDAKKLVAANTALNNPLLSTPLTEAQASFIIKKQLLRQALPQRPEDLGGWDMDIQTAADNAPYLNLSEDHQKWIDPDSNLVVGPFNQNLDAVSSAVLHLALVEGSSVRAFPGGKSYQLPVLDESNLKANHHREVSLSTAYPTIFAEAFYDEWDQPLRFYTFPTSLIAAANAGANQARVRAMLPGLPQALGGDPLDPVSRGLHIDFNTGSSTIDVRYDLVSAANVVSLARPFSETFHTVGAFSMPLLISSGADEQLGLGNPHSTTYTDRLAPITNADALNDNITSKQQ